MRTSSSSYVLLGISLAGSAMALKSFPQPPGHELFRRQDAGTCRGPSDQCTEADNIGLQCFSIIEIDPQTGEVLNDTPANAKALRDCVCNGDYWPLLTACESCLSSASLIPTDIPSALKTPLSALSTSYCSPPDGRTDNRTIDGFIDYATDSAFGTDIPTGTAFGTAFGTASGTAAGTAFPTDTGTGFGGGGGGGGGFPSKASISFASMSTTSGGASSKSSSASTSSASTTATSQTTAAASVASTTSSKGGAGAVAVRGGNALSGYALLLPLVGVFL